MNATREWDACEAPKGRVSTRFILRSRLSTEHHYAFKPSPCLKRVELPLNEQIFNTIGISGAILTESTSKSEVDSDANQSKTYKNANLSHF
ncbi:hypothetical protein ACRN98_20420 [Shewanella oncorhynchi]|uniref:hypothetical protein n=1 Tax=Shewanella TaxID=22 RepID=UPI0021DA9A3C|nr:MULTISPECIES: hypothetical protein [unclassified Shewanella]MCU7964999.1 hypothetical protein [Shewanella sp. SW32]MCU7972957.1 hypothetical protein [Shewanella sp. SW29]